ncbi:winged helix-turn-helix domain-containing protein [Massilia sp. Root351]|uniref:ATP-binding protein n=1 Tax=Massilia sp. Root351 TaxID=1736522 RepID=UPI0009E83984|nr:winged helix-turn-helix domain-containing protein [Massilia sp. Root351]
MDTLLEQDTDAIAFGRYTLLPGRGELHAGCGEDDGAAGRVVALGPRATAVLMALIASRGTVVSQNELLALAWPGQDIHASNLRVQIAALRKALGEDRNLIGTVAGRGYVFSGRLSAVPAAAAASARGAARPCTRQLPLPMAEMIGREAQLQDALARLQGCRLLTLAGTGGIGKTLLALAMAHRTAAASTGSVAWAELADVCDAPGAGAAVACALGMGARIPAEAGDAAAGTATRAASSAASGAAPGAAAARAEAGFAHTLATLAAHIGDQPMLLVLDNCEHLADAAARLVEELLQRCPQLRLLVTSRQPLLAAGETVWRVSPLAVPDVDVVDSAHLLQYSALQLFVARVRAADSGFHPTPRMAVQIAAICRRLEGLPLAIELAAACVPALGVEQTASGLDDMLRLLRRGRRNAPLRHQSMRAALDWSYALLAEPMRCALRHLSALPDGFTMEAAVTALAPQGFSLYEAIDALAGLVSHSLALVDHGGPRARYRLSATTRAYALELRSGVAG